MIFQLNKNTKSNFKTGQITTERGVEVSSLPAVQDKQSSSNRRRSNWIWFKKVILGLFVGFGVFLGAFSSEAAETSKFSAMYSTFAGKGVPPLALKRALKFMDLNFGKTIRVRGAGGYVLKKIGNDRHLVIVDFSKPSSRRRLYLLDLKTGTVGSSYVAHGKGSGDNIPVKFSNKNESKMSSLGFYVTGGTYIGGHGRSIYLYGTEGSNDRARERMIVIHPANYATEAFVKSHGRLGRSWGCPAVSDSTMKALLPIIKDQTVVYAHHDKLLSK